MFELLVDFFEVVFGQCDWVFGSVSLAEDGFVAQSVSEIFIQKFWKVIGGKEFNYGLSFLKLCLLQIDFKGFVHFKQQLIFAVSDVNELFDPFVDFVGFEAGVVERSAFYIFGGELVAEDLDFEELREGFVFVCVIGSLFVFSNFSESISKQFNVLDWLVLLIL